MVLDFPYSIKINKLIIILLCLTCPYSCESPVIILIVGKLSPICFSSVSVTAASIYQNNPDSQSWESLIWISVYLKGTLHCYRSHCGYKVNKIIDTHSQCYFKRNGASFKDTECAVNQEYLVLRISSPERLLCSPKEISCLRKYESERFFSLRKYLVWENTLAHNDNRYCTSQLIM